MIVEFFGPPGSGKTTFALALADHLRKAGHPVMLRLSSRPGEDVSAPGKAAGEGRSAPLTSALRRLVTPAYELVVNSQAPIGPSNGRIADALIEALPRGQIFRSLRMRQYLVRLSHAWEQAVENNNIWIFDQAYVQVIASIAVVQTTLSDEAILGLLDITPQADLIIRVEAPAGDIESRLDRRKQGMGGVGRLLEEARVGVSEQAEVAQRIDGLLRRSRRQVLTMRSADADPLDVQVGVAEHAVLTTYNELRAEHQ